MLTNLVRVGGGLAAMVGGVLPVVTSLTPISRVLPALCFLVTYL